MPKGQIKNKNFTKIQEWKRKIFEFHNIEKKKLQAYKHNCEFMQNPTNLCKFLWNYINSSKKKTTIKKSKSYKKEFNRCMVQLENFIVRFFWGGLQSNLNMSWGYFAVDPKRILTPKIPFLYLTKPSNLLQSWKNQFFKK